MGLLSRTGARRGGVPAGDGTVSATMGVHVIRVPDLGEGIAEVELVAWRVAPGDLITEDQVLADVMTEKATVEIPSPVAGTVLALGGEVGQSLAVGSELIRIDLESGGTAPGTATPALDRAVEAAAAPPGPGPSAAMSPAPPIAVRTAPTPMATPTAAQARPIASPAVRARAWELGIDLNDVHPTGTAGRITQADLDAHRAQAAPRTLPPAPAPARAAPAVDATRVVKIIGLRRRIAQKMQESKRRIPHFTYVEEVDVSELERLRAHLNAKWDAQRAHLTLLPFLIQAIVLAVREFPQVNARFDDEADTLTQHAAVHVGIATQTDMGLMVPVLRDAQARDLWANATEITRLAEAARSGKAVRDELAGSTLTITSLGRLGGVMSTPVINHPEVAIIGINRIVQRPVILDGAIVARQVMNLSSSFDHRVVDGAIAAAFVQRLRAGLERPATLFIE
jgi:2-oxoisovalerate dehydrogenase E2 component (dihydrolipoyl transacylase)